MSSKGSTGIYLSAEDNEKNRKAFADAASQMSGWKADVPTEPGDGHVELYMETDDAGYAASMVGVACDAMHALCHDHGAKGIVTACMVYESYEDTGDDGSRIELSFDSKGRLAFYRESVMEMREAELPCEIAAALALL